MACTRLLGALALAAAPAAALVQRPPIYPAQDVDLPGRADELATFDWTGDGLPDVVALHQVEGRLSFTPATGEGTLGAATVLSFPVSPTGLAIGDVNGDGTPDVIVLTLANPRTVEVLLALGGGSFSKVTSVVTAATDEYPQSATVSDVDGDGDADLSVLIFPEVLSSTSPRNSWVTVLTGDGTGGFQPTGAQHLVGELGRDIAGLDLDHDGVLDCATANNGSASLSVLVADGLGGYLPAASVATHGQPFRLATSDLDSDGNEDVVVGSSLPSLLPVHRGNGSGGLLGAQLYGEQRSRRRVATGDFDGDGWTDVASGGGAPAVILNDGTGGLATETEVFLASTLSLATGDLDGDGNLDLFVGGSLFTTVLLGDGSGVLGSLEVYEQGGGEWVESRDMNGDGNLDLILGEFHSVAVRLGDGAGSFAPPTSTEVSIVPISAAVADVDLDGAPDVAVSEFELFGFGPPVQELSVLRGNGTGGLLPPFVQPLTEPPGTISLGDLDGDGIPDVVVPFSQSDHIGLYAGDGAGGLVALPSVPSGGTGLSDATVADLDADGDLDVAVVDTAQAMVGVLAGDGAGGLSAPVKFYPGATPSKLSAHDLDGDGLVDLVTRNVAFVFPWTTGISVLGALPGGGYSSPAIYTTSEGGDGSLRVADVDGDGERDIVLAGEAIEVLRGQGGTFPQTESYVGESYDIALGDFDSDGAVDVASSFVDLVVHPNRVAGPPGVSAFGSGTPGCAGTHLAFGSEMPKVGASGFRITCNAAPPGSVGFLTTSLGAIPAGFSLLGLLVHVDLSVPAGPTRFATGTADGLASVPVPIPPSSGLAGAKFHSQWVWYWPPTACVPSPVNLSTSRGLTIEVQP